MIIKVKLFFSFLFCLFLYLVVEPVTVFSQQGAVTVFTATGSASAASRDEAMEAARLDAASKLVFYKMKHDRVYRDLFIPEAYKNGWFHDVNASQNPDASWSASAQISVDESLADALYVGRYSTTVTNLLDSAESGLADLELLLSDGGLAESNAELSAAETAYRRSEAKAEEILRYLDPVEDAVYFSSIGKRKSFELKALVSSLQDSAREGIQRIHESQSRLAMSEQAESILSILNSIETELASCETSADELSMVAAAPRSYTTDTVRSARDTAVMLRENLLHKKTMTERAVLDLPVDSSYPRVRSDLILDRIQALELRLDKAESGLSRDLVYRSAPVQTLSWIFNHEPKQIAAISVVFPWSVYPDKGSSVWTSFPVYAEARAEGAFSLGEGGFWCATDLYAGRETLLEASHRVLCQSVSAAFYGKALTGLGFRWDWLRSDKDGTAVPSMAAVQLVLGTAGNGLGTERNIPLWLNTFSWELPLNGDYSSASVVNLGLKSCLRPSVWIRIEADAAVRIRDLPDTTAFENWIGTAGAGFALRLPVLKPFLWRIRWEGAMQAPMKGSVVDFDEADAQGAFRFGLEYTF